MSSISNLPLSPSVMDAVSSDCSIREMMDMVNKLYQIQPATYALIDGELVRCFSDEYEATVKGVHEMVNRRVSDIVNSEWAKIQNLEYARTLK